MKSCIFQRALRLRAITVAGAISLAATASVALAQDHHDTKSGSSAAAPKSGTVSGVVVQPRANLHKIPPHKRAAFDAEAANKKAWTNYRNSPAPPLGTGPGASSNAGNYPGLSKLGSH
jgi:hypothetical protein